VFLNEVSTNIAGPMAAILFDEPKTSVLYGTPLPVWMTNRTIDQRMNVWAALGILIEHAHTDADAVPDAGPHRPRVGRRKWVGLKEQWSPAAAEPARSSGRDACPFVPGPCRTDL
jgi:hypothetical protein